MGKKTGKKANYIPHGGGEVKDVINGREVGVSFDNSTRTHYVMLPNQKTGRTKRKWLGRDKEKAVARFIAIVSQLKGEKEKSIVVDIKPETIEHRLRITGIPTPAKFRDIQKNKDKVVFVEDGATAHAKESEFIEWLKRELRNPSELARKTGYEAFNFFYDFMNQEPIKLSELYENYTKSVRYRRIKDKDERKKTKAAWELFLSLIDKASLEQITLADVKALETYLHSQDYSEKTIHHYKNRVSKIFRYNLKVYEDTVRLQRVIGYFSKWEELEINSVSSISAQAISHSDFMKLHDAASIELKAILMLCLNTGTYIREVARLKRSEIDIEQQTLMTRRNKKGRCRKFAYLWDRTVVDLRDYLAARTDKSDVLFRARHGGEYTNGAGLRTKLWNLRKEVGLLNVEFSHLRDTFETVSKEIGSISQYHIDMVMGHSSGRTSERYTHRRIHNELMNACLAVEKEFFGEE